MAESILIMLAIYLGQLSIFFVLWKFGNTLVSGIASGLLIFTGVALVVWSNDIIIQGIPSIGGSPYDPRINVAIGLVNLSLGLVMISSRIIGERKKKKSSEQ